MKQSDYNPNQPYDSELLAKTVKVLTPDQRMELYPNSDGTTEIRIHNFSKKWIEQSNIVIGTLI